MKGIRQAIVGLVHGVMSGMFGGLVAGFIFGLAITIYSYIESGDLPNSLIDIVFPYLSGSLGTGLIGGCLIGGIVGITLPLTRTHLLRISQILGGITAMVPSIIFLTPDEPLLSGIIGGIALIAGIAGGTMAFQFYTKIYE